MAIDEILKFLEFRFVANNKSIKVWWSFFKKDFSKFV